ncbi:hypothetical protein MFRU_002g02680 [Monilinia fructicola]|uniref:Uncharacterized protein n=1 Tax=Monilinia fructicola TaxID=38448 RepID=A0A5M9K021_MONFR|nr:hypothetical protein EYC84_004351 [Monilinia fructicola]KAG4034919.1 hypothetical protein MFRU_002g02680 [Monilinia fructicola]
MTSPTPTNAGTSMDASGITAEIKALAMSGQENFVPAAEEASQASHSFLSLAPKTSVGYPYPAAQLSKLPGASTPRNLVDIGHTRVAAGGDEFGEKRVGDDTNHAKGSGDTDAEKELGKASRSESMSSEASNSTTSSVGTQKGMSSKRFLKLGPVHFGEEGLGDWSEEVVE